MPEPTFYRRGEEVLGVGLEHRRLVLGRSGLSDVVKSRGFNELCVEPLNEI
jgi:hypothetical protein